MIELEKYQRWLDRQDWTKNTKQIYYTVSLQFDASRVVPFSTENRPVSMSLYPCIRVS